MRDEKRIEAADEILQRMPARAHHARILAVATTVEKWREVRGVRPRNAPQFGVEGARGYGGFAFQPARFFSFEEKREKS